MVKIVHVSDIHIKNRTRHEEYKKVFENLYESIKNIEGEKITVITGDIMDHHGTTTNEANNLMTTLISSLSELCVLILISGNHDTALGNTQYALSSLDFLIPIIKNQRIYILNNLNRSIKINNINFTLTDLKETEIYKIKKNKNEINVALYHGTLNKSTTNTNYKFEDKIIKASDFKNYDYAMLGDIHKFQYMNKNKTIAYSGSLMQQNKSESIDKHGYILWDFENKTSSFIEINNSYCYAKATLENGKLILHEEEKIKKLNKSILNVEIYYRGEDLNLIDTKIKELRKDYKIIISGKTCIDITQNIFNNKGTQNNSIIEIYKKIATEKGDIVCDDIINEFINIEKTMLSESNKMLKLKYIKFKNILSYNGWYEINFEKMVGMTTITGENGIGKSSIIDIIMYLLYDKPIRGSSRNIMNIDNDTMEGEICVNLNEKNYIINRSTCEKSASVCCYELDMNGEKKELILGETKNVKESEIQKMFGNNETLILLSLYLQDGDATLSMSNTKKYKTFLKLLNVDKYYDIKALHLTKYNSSLKNITTTEKIIEEIKIKINEGEHYAEDLTKLKNQKKILTDEYEKLKTQNIELNLKILNVDYSKLKNDLIKIKNTQYEKNNYEKKLMEEKEKYGTIKLDYTEKFNNYKNEDIKLLDSERNEYLSSKKNSEEELKKLENYEKNDDEEIQKLHNSKNELEQSKISIKENYENKKNTLQLMEENLKNIDNKNFNDLEKINELFTFNSKCKTCASNKKIFMNNQSKEEYNNLKNIIKTLRSEILLLEKKEEKINESIRMLENSIEINTKHLKKMKELLEKNNKVKLIENINLMNNLINAIRAKMEGYENYVKNEKKLIQLNAYQTNILLFEEKIRTIEQNTNDIINIENELNMYEETQKTININNENMNEIINIHINYENAITKLTELMGGINVHMENLNIQQQTLNNYKKENDISKNIIKIFNEYGIINELANIAISKLEIIMNDMIMSIMDYKVKIELQDKELIIYKLENGKKINSETLSGSQKFIIGLALKCSLNKIGLAFKTNFQIIDENFNCIDSEKILKLEDLLNLINREFEMVLIITHNEEILNKIHKNINLQHDKNTQKIKMIQNF
jgi:DNA repair exonuclease SbcCD ATPase subunit